MEMTLSSDARSTSLAKRMAELRGKKAALEIQVNEIDAELDQVRAELTLIMQELGVQKFGLENLGTFYLSTNIYPKVLDNDGLIKWLDDHALSNIAPRKVHIASLKEMFETRMEQDQEVPTTSVDMTPETSVRFRASKKGA